MRSNNFYILCFVISLLLSILVNVYRESLYGMNVLLDIVLGSSPSFLYFLGLSALVAILTRHLKFNSVLKITFILMLGALTYEIEQYWSSRVFDLYDMAAILLAFSVFVFAHLESLLEKNV